MAAWCLHTVRITCVCTRIKKTAELLTVILSGKSVEILFLYSNQVDALEMGVAPMGLLSAVQGPPDYFMGV